MKKDKINELLSDDYKVKVAITYGSLKTWFEKENSNVIYPVYYNHVKKHLSEDQIKLIELYSIVKNYQYKDDVEINIKHKSGKETKSDIALRVVRHAYKHGEYLEQ